MYKDERLNHMASGYHENWRKNETRNQENCQKNPQLRKNGEGYQYFSLRAI